MNKIRVAISVIGQPPPDLMISRVSNWGSEVWELTGDVQSYMLSENADLDGWGFSDSILQRIVRNGNEADITFCILNVPLEDNYYSRRLKGNTVCFSFYEIAEVLRAANIPLHNAVLRMIYSYCMIYKRSKDRIPPISSLVKYAHDEARGCLFDMNGIKTEIIFSCHSPTLCESCRSDALRDGVSREYIERFGREITRIKKELYYQIADLIKRHPVTSILISLIVAFLLNLGSSFFYDLLKSRSDLRSYFGDGSPQGEYQELDRSIDDSKPNKSMDSTDVTAPHP